jgi:hypothetical protein
VTVWSPGDGGVHTAPRQGVPSTVSVVEDVTSPSELSNASRPSTEYVWVSSAEIDALAG